MSRRKLRLTLEGPEGGEELLVTEDFATGIYRVQRGDRTSAADVAELPDGRLSLLFDDGRQVCGRVSREGTGALVSTRSGVRRVPLADPRRHRSSLREADAGAGTEEVRALMPGRVLEVFAREGEPVAAGAVLLVLEAMKMQNDIRASRAGRVAKVAVQAGQAVEGGALMILLEASEPSR